MLQLNKKITFYSNWSSTIYRKRRNGCTWQSRGEEPNACRCVQAGSDGREQQVTRSHHHETAIPKTNQRYILVGPGAGARL